MSDDDTDRIRRLPSEGAPEPASEPPLAAAPTPGPPPSAAEPGEAPRRPPEPEPRAVGRRREPGRPPPRRGSRRVPVVTALVAALVALAIGIAIGYAVRGDPAPASLQTLEREVPVVTVTVPEGEAPPP